MLLVLGLVLCLGSSLQAGIGMPVGSGGGCGGVGGGNSLGFGDTGSISGNSATGSSDDASGGDTGGSGGSSAPGASGSNLDGAVDIPITIAKNIGGVDPTSIQFSPGGAQNLSTPHLNKSFGQRVATRQARIGTGTVIGYLTGHTLNHVEEHVAVIVNGEVLETVYAVGGNFRIALGEDYESLPFVMVGRTQEAVSHPIIVRVTNDPAIADYTVAVSITNLASLGESLAVSEDGTIAFPATESESKAAIYTQNILGGEPAKLLSLDEPAENLKYDPLNTLYWVASDSNVLCRLSSGSADCSGLSSKEPETFHYSFSPNGLKIAENTLLSSNNQGISLYTASTKAVKTLASISNATRNIETAWYNNNALITTLQKENGTYNLMYVDVAAASPTTELLHSQSTSLKKPTTDGKGIYFVCDSLGGDGNICQYTDDHVTDVFNLDVPDNKCEIMALEADPDRDYLLFPIACSNELVDDDGFNLGSDFVAIYKHDSKEVCFIIRGTEPHIYPGNTRLIVYNSLVNENVEKSVLSLDNDISMKCYPKDDSPDSIFCQAKYVRTCNDIDNQTECAQSYMNLGYVSSSTNYANCSWKNGACSYQNLSNCMGGSGWDNKNSSVCHGTFRSSCSSLTWQQCTNSYSQNTAYFNCGLEKGVCTMVGSGCSGGSGGSTTSSSSSSSSSSTSSSTSSSSSSGGSSSLCNGITVQTTRGSTAFSNAASISAANSNGYLVTSSGRAYAWGVNTYGSLGDGTTTNSSRAVQVHGDGDVGFLTDAAAISGSDNNVYVLLSNGTVKAWGLNEFGGLGNNSLRNSYTPVYVYDLTGTGRLYDITAIAAGNQFGVALSSTGYVYTWGSNEFGALGDSLTGTTTVNGVNVAAYSVQAGVRTIVNISAKSNHVLAVKSDGTVWGWGQNENYTLANGTDSQYNSPTQIPLLSGVTKVSAGEKHSLALTSSGTVYAWGDNDYGQLGFTGADTARPTLVSGLTGVTAIAAGRHSSYALTSDGTVWVWGIAAPRNDTTAYTYSTATPVKICAISGAVEISASSNGNQASVLVRTSSGTVIAVGTANGTGESSADETPNYIIEP